MKDFFISYTKADREWAEWIAWQLEEKNYSVIIQAWDFRPGGNFIIDMQKASEEAERTIAVLSPDYLQALYTQPEWAAAFGPDPTGSDKKLVPVRVRKCDLKGMLANIVYIDLVGCSESDARKALLDGIKKERVKPKKSPDFPGRAITEKPGFPEAPGVKISISKLPTTGKDLFGRERELEMLDGVWRDGHTHVVCFVAWGGVGKTALVNEWLNRMAADHFRGAERVYGWSFYSQGAAEGKQASADEFMQETLKWFGDPDPTAGSAVDKARRLADLIKEERTLLILDGMEPLQYPPGELSGFDGRLKDQGLKALLKELAASQPGLCMVTTRVHAADLADKVGRTVKEVELEHLSDEAGVQLLKSLGVKGADKEIAEAVKEYNGHALALNLLGNYISVVYDGDIRKRDLAADITEEVGQGAHARRVMQSYERWLSGKPELDILSMMGLFDRPVPMAAVEALKKEPLIKGVTDKLKGLSNTKWHFCLKRLRDLGLLARKETQQKGTATLDCHPLIREHFGQRLKEENRSGWKAAHTRLYHFFKDLPEKKHPDTLEEMAPLFSAVAHGCAAGLHPKALIDVYWQRISRGREGFVFAKLGGFGSILSVIANFFEVPWSKPAAGLSGHDKASVLNWAGFRLRAVGRLQEAVQPMEAGLEMHIKQKNWRESAKDAGNLSELLLCMGRVDEAVAYARRSVDYADQSGDDFLKESFRTALADALLQSGDIKEAETWIKEAETMHKECQPELPYLYGFAGFHFCDLLLAQGKYQEVSERAEKTLEWSERFGILLDIALNQLSLGRAQLLQTLAEETGDFTKAADYLERAVAGLREAGQQQCLAPGLMIRAGCFRLQGRFKEAWADLKEAQEIAELGGMKLYLADFHLEAGKLCAAEGRKQEAAEHFGRAKELMEEMGYGRKLGEVKKALG